MQTMRRIILPQAIRICIPPMGNEMVNLVLNSSLAMVIGYAELTDTQFYQADMNMDGSLNIQDLVILANIILGN